MHPLLHSHSAPSTNAPGLTGSQRHGDYPTRDEILAGLYTPTEKERLALKIWKGTHYKDWSLQSKYYKILNLENLIVELSAEHNSPVVVSAGHKWAYYPDLKMILTDQDNPSIISALHEFGHHLFGSSELKACQYSVGIFMDQFKSAYDKLVWDGHMLVKPKTV
jgi:hypothetical protein